MCTHSSVWKIMVRWAPGKSVLSHCTSALPERCRVSPVVKSMKSRAASGSRVKLPAQEKAVYHSAGPQHMLLRAYAWQLCMAAMHGSCLCRVTTSWEAMRSCDAMPGTRSVSSARVVYDDCVLVHLPLQSTQQRKW